MEPIVKSGLDGTEIGPVAFVQLQQQACRDRGEFCIRVTPCPQKPGLHDLREFVLGKRFEAQCPERVWALGGEILVGAEHQPGVLPEKPS